MNMLASILLCLAGVVASVLPAPPVPPVPHADGEDYVFLTFLEQSIEGRFEIHFDDLNEKLGLAVDPSEARALDDAERVAARVHAYVRKHFVMGPVGGPRYEFEFTDVGATVLPKGTFASYSFRIAIDALPDAIAFEHSMFYENDRVHRGLLCVDYNAKTGTDYPDEYTALVFGPMKRKQVLDLTAIPTIFGPREMIPEGVQHVWADFDHVLFLLGLLLTTVLVFRETWQPAESFAPAFWSLARVVTVFAVAHSAALFLAAFDLLLLPPQLVGCVLALSILLVAVNNITGTVRDGVLWLVGILGVFHGLWLATAMGDLPFRMGRLFRIVVGFNIGVELGLALAILVVFPLLFALRRTAIYETVILKGSSAVLGAVATWWLVERAFGLGTGES